MNKFILLLIFVIGLFSFGSCAIKIIDRPVDFTKKRIQLTKDYMADHYGIHPKDISIEPKIIVLHWTETNTLQEAFDIFKPDTIQYRGIVSKSSKLNVSVQFLVDRDGSIYRIMPETWMGRHAIGINYNSIGVENIAGADNTDNLTNEQLKANIKLVKYLAKKYPSIKYLIGHYEYTDFENTPLWLEKDDNYRTLKTDPSKSFMAKVRKATKSLGLKKPA